MPPAFADQHDPDSNSAGRDHRGIDTVEHLADHLAEFASGSMVIVCIGNTLAGDDAAGVEVGKKLSGQIPWKVFNTQTVPESFLMKIVELKPESVLLVDALDFGVAPGAVEVVSAEGITGQGPSTHGPAPLAFLELLGMMHPCRCAVLGIQPKSGDLDAPLSDPVAKAVDMVVHAFKYLAQRPQSATESR